MASLAAALPSRQLARSGMSITSYSSSEQGKEENFPDTEPC